MFRLFLGLMETQVLSLPVNPHTHTHTTSCILTAAASSPSHSNDVDMEVDHFTNGVTESSSNGFLNGSAKHAGEPDNCDADMGE